MIDFGPNKASKRYTRLKTPHLIEKSPRVRIVTNIINNYNFGIIAKEYQTMAHILRSILFMSVVPQGKIRELRLVRFFGKIHEKLLTTGGDWPILGHCVGL